jgi:hypothetical protein
MRFDLAVAVRPPRGQRGRWSGAQPSWGGSGAQQKGSMPPRMTNEPGDFSAPTASEEKFPVRILRGRARALALQIAAEARAGMGLHERRHRPRLPHPPRAGQRRAPPDLRDGLWPRALAQAALRHRRRAGARGPVGAVGRDPGRAAARRLRGPPGRRPAAAGGGACPAAAAGIGAGAAAEGCGRGRWRAPGRRGRRAGPRAWAGPRGHTAFVPDLAARAPGGRFREGGRLRAGRGAEPARAHDRAERTARASSARRWPSGCAPRRCWPTRRRSRPAG